MLRFTIPRSLLALLLGGIALGSAAPANAEKVALPDVLQVALRQNPSLASARIDIDIARAQVVQSQGIEDLLLRASGTYFLREADTVDGNVIGTNSSSSAQGEVSIAKLLGTGGTLTLRAASSRRASTFAVNNTEITEYNSELSLRLDQPLLRGRGKELSRAGQSQAKFNRSAAQLDLQARAQNEIRGIVDAYWELVWSHRDLEIRVSALELTRARRKLTESAIALGSVPRSALVAIDQVVATQEEDILISGQNITTRSLELRRLTGLEIGPDHLDLHPDEDLRTSPKKYDMRSVVNRALQTSPELAALSARGKGAKIAIAVADNGLLPSLNLNVSAGPLGTDSGISGSLSGAATGKGYFVGAGLSYEQALHSQRAQGNRAEAQARVRQVLVGERDLRAQIATAAATAVQAAEIAQKRMELSTRAIGLSEQNIEIEKRRFESGRSTNFDVLERQEELKQARLRYARATVDYLRAENAIQTLRGEILTQYGITL
ncbi:MAG: TolC family protein [Kofleriaceae bacterium]|nr:TolC family protein [Kofleriaceae bacterium]